MYSGSKYCQKKNYNQNLPITKMGIISDFLRVGNISVPLRFLKKSRSDTSSLEQVGLNLP